MDQQHPAIRQIEDDPLSPAVDRSHLRSDHFWIPFPLPRPAELLCPGFHVANHPPDKQRPQIAHDGFHFREFGHQGNRNAEFGMRNEERA
jgi:hypothetical protein